MMQLFWRILYSLYDRLISGWFYIIYTEFAYYKQFITLEKRYFSVCELECCQETEAEVRFRPGVHKYLF